MTHKRKSIRGYKGFLLACKKSHVFYPLLLTRSFLVSKSKVMNIYEAIRRDHAIIFSWAQRLGETLDHDLVTRQFLVGQLTYIFEDLSRLQYLAFYLPLRLATPYPDPTVDSVENHKELNELLMILKTVLKNDLWFECLSDFQRILENHIAQEQTFLFFVAQEHFSDTDSEEIGNCYEFLKQQGLRCALDARNLDQALQLLPSRFAKPLRKVFFDERASDSGARSA